jgi:GTP pyrophosphokinase
MINFSDFYAYQTAYEMLDEDAKMALTYATKAHSGQTRSDGRPYVKHPEAVANIVKQFKRSANLDALVSAALLHDTIEDTDTTHQDLEKLFGGLVASLVQQLTSDKDKIAQMGKTEYMSQKMAKMSNWALVVKLADRLHNIQDITYAKTPEWRKKYKKETLSVMDRLEKDRDLTNTHKKIIKSIRKKLSEVPD